MSAANDHAVEAVGLIRRFGDFVALDRVSLQIPKGQLYDFLGLNGAGRLQPSASLFPEDCGLARWLRHPRTGARARNQELGNQGPCVQLKDLESWGFINPSVRTQRSTRSLSQ
jgi:hypothetical protein